MRTMACSCSSVSGRLASAWPAASTPPVRGGVWRVLRSVPLQCHSAGQRAVDVSLGIRGDAFLRSVSVGIGNERSDLAVLGTADGDAFMESGVRLCVGL